MNSATRLWVALSGPALIFGQTPPAHSAGPAAIEIRVVEGDGALNDIRLRRAHAPVVEVVNRAGAPLQDATVTFLLPATGASGTFGESGLSVTVQTDAKGMATGRGLRPNRMAGPFRIRVTASWKGESAGAVLTQTNVGPPSNSSSRTKKVAILAVIGGAAVGGIVAATQGGSKSSTGASGAAPGSSGTGGGATTISVGDPSLGPPH